MTDGTWRPQCFTKMHVEWREECKRCPFGATCRRETKLYRDEMRWNTRDDGDFYEYSV